MRFPKCRGPLLCALVLCTLIPLHAQQNSEINGIVTDPTGSAIVGAQVTLTDEGTGNARNTATDSAGLFTFPALNVGTYTVQVTAQGI
jgi:carboxypeptidase family protein